MSGKIVAYVEKAGDGPPSREMLKRFLRARKKITVSYVLHSRYGLWPRAHLIGGDFIIHATVEPEAVRGALVRIAFDSDPSRLKTKIRERLREVRRDEPNEMTFYNVSLQDVSNAFPVDITEWEAHPVLSPHYDVLRDMCLVVAVGARRLVILDQGECLCQLVIIPNIGALFEVYPFEKYNTELHCATYYNLAIDIGENGTDVEAVLPNPYTFGIVRNKKRRTRS